VINHQKHTSKNNIQYKVTEYKTSSYSCDGRGCTNDTTNCFKVFYLKKPCWLCSTCAQDFEEDGLIESIIHKDIENGGKSHFVSH
jgi:hypothetical protein